MDYSRLSMPLGEAIFTQRSIRRFRPDPIPVADIRLVIEAAVRAPNGGNRQIARFLVVNDRTTILEFGAIEDDAEPGVHLAACLGLRLGHMAYQFRATMQHHTAILPHIFAQPRRYLVARFGFAGIDSLGQLSVHGCIG